MKQLLLLFIATFLVAASGQATRIYVSPAANGSLAGSSWANATSVEDALARVVAGDEVWMLQGTYPTSRTGNREASFVVPAGVQVYGGFLGSEASPTERPAGVKSILSGDIGVVGEHADNAYTVVLMLSAGNLSSILDGFVITHGCARNFREGFGTGSAGGGLFIQGAPGATAAHQISNCHFTANRAHNGAAVFVSAGRPSFIACSFVYNTSDYNGGAVYNYGVGSEVSPIFNQCQFVDNGSNSGAGMTNNGTNGSASPLLLDCNFTNNVSTINGAAIYNISNDTGRCNLVMEGCTFEGNDSILGEDVSDSGVSPDYAERARQNGGGTLRPVSVKR
ncbi:hypothetical protein QWY85_16825 [Neolewinella lacunae]|uniref:Right handed beta helix domain-containing protein n=1 Tax=Neolewinella lacunae TaxID=1517758 RepID=A0A923T791_9BACT|nr:hypothetical protein [Neolewinella lacunae]MBC6993341.1 hypothetical protein [Neolewinella lacunae]MDN3636331.1 hypothetical protein [Neolewinella lacunae]